MMPRWPWVALGLLGAGGHAAEPVRVPDADRAPYEDRVLDEAPQAVQETEPAAPDTGWRRGGSVELQSLRQGGANRIRNETLQIDGYLDTPNHGTFSADLHINRYRNRITVDSLGGRAGNLFYSLSYRDGSTGRIDQRGMPFGNGWFANNSIGNINTAATPMSRGMGRVYLPSLPIEGFSSSLEQGTRTTLNLSAGRLGFFEGLDSQGFALGRGNTVTLGAQRQIGGGDNPLGIGRSDAAFQWVETRNANLNGLPGFAQDTRSLWGAVSWQGVAPWAEAIGPGIGPVQERPGGLRVQANYAHSTGQPSVRGSLAPRDSANGLWVDALWRGDWLQQGVSVFSFDPALRWGSNPLAGDLRGASWRGDLSTRQWQLSANVEASDSVSGMQGRSVFGNLYGRYRFDSRDALAVTLAARSGRQAAQSLQLSWERISPRWGQSQWRADFAHGERQRLARIGVDHQWRVGESSSLSTTLAFEQSRQYGFSTRSVIWGVLGSLPFLAGGRLDLSARGSNGMGDNTSRYLDANARVMWPLGAGWSVVAQYTAARGREPFNPAVVSALTTAMQAPVFKAPSNRSMQVALRWEASAGVNLAPIGGAPGMGSGRLEGHVYFDPNNNGQREAGEGGVPNVTVTLDRRYVARTDAQGYYAFPAVATGSYRIEVVPDNVPLPWAVVSRDGVMAQVYVRSTAVADFAVQRER
ncbi:SdrD B-like domain-containing protein [Variovorax rhizosphaerae]|uniref:SdrD B-like domain-containing protein n=1 Tax=Variovorax rhizosphaerae TaxID=1836200 RepID=A0ABU8WHD0_9BURK